MTVILEEGERGHRVDIDDVKAPIFVIDAGAQIVEVNRRLTAITGFTNEELIRRGSRMFFPDGQRHPRPDPLADEGSYRAHAFSPDALVNISRKDGSVFSARLVSTPARSVAHGVVHIVAVLNAIQLRLDEIGFRGMLESAPDATVVLDEAGRIVVANQLAASLFRLHRDEMDGRNIASLFSTTYADDARAWFAELYAHALDGGSVNGRVSTFPLHAARADGEEVPIEVAASALHVGEGMFLRVAIRDVTDRLMLQSAADDMKAQFLATVSHELRTPLSSIVGYAELLGDLEDDEVGALARKFVAVISRNARRELRLVDDLLTVVSIQSGDMVLTPDLMDLLQVVNESGEGFQPLAKEAGIDLVVQCSDSTVPMFGDSVRLGQVADNLISNAIKFAPAGTKVLLRVSRDGVSARLEVIDSGPGIPLYERLRAFDRFFRGARALTEEKAGAGLGLAIVKAIVEAHRGSVTIHCPEAGGTTVSVVLPSS